MTNPHELVPTYYDPAKAWIQTFTGGIFHLLETNPDEIDIFDIAHSLSQQCRFTGHTREFYSVAEHSYFASLIVPSEDAMWALMHDSSEAYLADLNRPLKHYTELGPAYKKIEDRVMSEICKKFGLDPVQPKSVHDADVQMLYAEKAQIMSRLDWETKWSLDEKAAPVVLKCWPPKKAEHKFLTRYFELKEKAA